MYWFGNVVSTLMAVLVLFVLVIFAAWVLFATPFGLLVIGAFIVYVLIMWAQKPSKE